MSDIETKHNPVPVDISAPPHRRSPEELLNQRRNLIKALGQSMLEIDRLRTELYADSLTGTANRKAFDDNFENLVNTAHENNEPIALMLIDLDELKRANDHPEVGHAGGDKLIKTAAVSAKENSRPDDLVGRFGGDELYAIMPGFLPMEGQSEHDLVEQVAARYAKGFEESIGALGLPDGIDAGASFGIAILKPDESAEDFFHRTDLILQANKQAKYQELAANGIVHTDSRLRTAAN